LKVALVGPNNKEIPLEAPKNVGETARVEVESGVPAPHGSDAAGSSRTVALETKVPESAPIAEVTGKQSGIEEGTDLGDDDSAPHKAGWISSPTSSLYSRLSNSITSFVEEGKSSKETVGASNYLRILSILCGDQSRKRRRNWGNNMVDIAWRQTLNIISHYFLLFMDITNKSIRIAKKFRMT
jgi:hypothetical protein